MHIVSFVSSYHGQCRTTTNMVSTAVYKALNYSNLKILMLHTQYIMSHMETFFKLNSKFEDIGLDYLSKLSKSNMLCPEEISNYTNTIIDNKLELLQGTKAKSLEEYEDMEDSIEDILNCSKQAYDFVFVDCSSIVNLKNKMTKKILEMSDIIVVNLNQNINVLRDFRDNEAFKELLKDKKSIIVIGDYDRNCIHNVEKIEKYLKSPVLEIPHCSELMYATNEEKLLQFIRQYSQFNSNSDLINENSLYYIKSLKNVCDEIIALSDIKEYKKIERVVFRKKKESLLKRLFV